MLIVLIVMIVRIVLKCLDWSRLCASVWVAYPRWGGESKRPCDPGQPEVPHGVQESNGPRTPYCPGGPHPQGGTKAAAYPLLPSTPLSTDIRWVRRRESIQTPPGRYARFGVSEGGSGAAWGLSGGTCASGQPRHWGEWRWCAHSRCPPLLAFGSAGVARASTPARPRWRRASKRQREGEDREVHSRPPPPFPQRPLSMAHPPLRHRRWWRIALVFGLSRHRLCGRYPHIVALSPCHSVLSAAVSPGPQKVPAASRFGQFGPSPEFCLAPQRLLRGGGLL